MNDFALKMAELKGIEIAAAAVAAAAATTTITSKSQQKLSSPSPTPSLTSSLLKTDKLYMQLNASELSAIILKGSPHSNDRDAGFCSGSSEGGDDCSIDNLRMEPSSPTDASEDSIEVKVMPISLTRNKRKSSEPSKVICEENEKLTDVSLTSPTSPTVSHHNLHVHPTQEQQHHSHYHHHKQTNNHGPFKKRIRYTSNSDSGVVLTTVATPTTTAATVTIMATSKSTISTLPPSKLSAPLVSSVPSAPSTPTPPIYSGRASTNASVVPTPPLALWDPSQMLPHELMPNPAEIFLRHPGVTTLHRVPEQDEPLALVIKKPSNSKSCNINTTSTSTVSGNELHGTEKDPSIETKRKNVNKTNKSIKLSVPKKRLSSALNTATTTAETIVRTTKICETNVDGETVSKKSRTDISATISNTSQTQNDTKSCPNQECSSSSSSSSGSGPSTGHKSQQRNYKNMTRERRIEANARERSRVHTISAAYETLRRAVPSYSSNQKLSKLSVLRVACSYILTLSRMAGYDYSQDGSEPSIASCFDAITATIQTEGKIRKKKDE